MLDLGTTFLCSVMRDPNAVAIIDGEMRLSYRAWFDRIASAVVGFDGLGLRPADHLVTLLQNRWEAATLHWACQLAGVIMTPLNWRSKTDEIDFCLDNADARAVVFQDVSADALAQSRIASSLPRISIGLPARRGVTTFESLSDGAAGLPISRASPEDWSVMVYTSGTTSRPKGVPRRHRAERAAGVAQVAHHLYRHGEITLGVMPLYHTMGIRSLVAMSLVGGTFVCMPRYDASEALRLIAKERITNLFLVPTLYHDLVHHESFARADTSSVRKLSFAGASMTDALLGKLEAAFQPELFVNHYGSSEIYTFTVNQRAPLKPGSAGRAGMNQVVRVVQLGATSPNEAAPVGEEGEIAALLSSDEAFEGYWRRPEADTRAMREGWYFTGDTGRFDEDGDLYVTGRVDDLIITGGEKVSPVEVESCLSMHPAVSEVAVVGLPDEKWGKIVVAAIQRRHLVTDDQLDQFCLESGLVNFKRPRRYIYVENIPKSPVGKLLRRMLISGDYELERIPPSEIGALCS